MNEQIQSAVDADRLAGVTLSFKDQEEYLIDSQNVRSLYIDGLVTSVELQADGSVKERHECKSLAMALRYREVNRQTTEAMAPGGGHLRLADRLINYRDVRVISLQYESGRTLAVEVPWSFRSREFNENMVAYRDNYRPNIFSILISRAEDLVRRHWDY